VLNGEHEFTGGQNAFVYIGSGSPVAGQEPRRKTVDSGERKRKKSIFIMLRNLQCVRWFLLLTWLL
jgi:hypothetical protein